MSENSNISIISYKPNFTIMTKSFSLKAMFLSAAALLIGVAAFAQQKSVSGTVKGEDGSPIPGVTVMIKGTTTGVSTDLDGKYSFNYTQANPVLAVSCIGYESQEIAIGTRTVINVTLVEETTSLDETVVVGYAVGNKRTITGAVERITEENMNTGYVSTAVDAIRGKVPGLVISSNGGNIQDNPTLRIRGTTSLSGGNSPLVIMDGVFGDVECSSRSHRMTSRRSPSSRTPPRPPSTDPAEPPVSLS